MAFRIDIRTIIEDTRGEVKKKQFGSREIKSVKVVDSYLIDKELKKGGTEKVARALANPILETYAIGAPYAPAKFDWAIEVGFLPGVTDNVGNTAKETIEDLLKRKFKPSEQIYSSQVLFITGKLGRSQVLEIAQTLYNPFF